jgi:hypothetical protein
MITKFEIRPNAGSPIEINTDSYPLSECDIFTNFDSKTFRKLAAPGEWPSFAYPGALTINVVGKILGTGVTPTEDYWDKRLALMDATLPPIQTLTSRQHGVIRVRMDGWSEDADTPVVVMSTSLPMQALYPAISDFRISWKGFVPYFTGASSAIYQVG